MQNTPKKTQKQLKQLKKDIANETAINIGYHTRIMQSLPNYAILDAVRKAAEIGDIKKMKDAELENIIVTEAVNSLNFQDFKSISKYFFQ